MCGIVYSRSLVGKPVNKTIKKRYLAQRHRGSDGFGFYVPDTNRLTHNPREGRILSLLRRQKKANEILFHHRMPTSTTNVRNACHPFSTKDYFEHNYVGVHNGVLWNEKDLKPSHELRGIKYVSMQEDGSFNDSEALTYDLAMYIEGEVEQVTAQGSIAFILIQRDKKGVAKAVYFGRNSGNPLMMKKTKDTFTLSSEGEGTLIDPNTMYCFNYETGVISRSPCRFPQYTNVTYNSGREGYWHNGSFYEEDDELYGFRNPNTGGSRDAFETEDLDQARQQYIYAEARRLYTENGENVQDAIDAGYEEVSDLIRIEERLRDSVEIEFTASDDETEKFYRVGDRLYYLRLAIKELEKEVSGQTQMGFHYTPDHSYPSSNWRDNRQERVDPVTGYAYYPYAT